MMDLEEHGGLLRRLIDLIEHFLEREDMSAQSDVDRATSAMTSAAATLNTDAPELETLLASEVDTGALSAAIAPLQAAVAGISALANPVTTATATSTTSSTSSTVVSSPATTGTGAPGDPVRPA